MNDTAEIVLETAEVAGLRVDAWHIIETHSRWHHPVCIPIADIRSARIRHGVSVERPIVQLVSGLLYVSFALTFSPAYHLLDNAPGHPSYGLHAVAWFLTASLVLGTLGLYLVLRVLIPRHHVELSTAGGTRRLAFRGTPPRAQLDDFQRVLEQHLELHRTQTQ